MESQKQYQHIYSCRDCNDFYDCRIVGNCPDTPCEYFVLRYNRFKEPKVVGELVSLALAQRYNKITNNHNL